MRKRHTPPPPHPGKILREEVLPGLGLTISQAARDLAITRQVLHHIFSGSASVTPNIARRLEKLCGTPAEFWLRLQNRYDLSQLNERADPGFDAIPHRALPENIAKRIGVVDGDKRT